MAAHCGTSRVVKIWQRISFGGKIRTEAHVLIYKSQNAINQEYLGHTSVADNVGIVFTALHGMQTRSYDEISVRLSVCLSVCPSVCLSNACIVTKRKKDMFRFLYHTKEHLS